MKRFATDSKWNAKDNGPQSRPNHLNLWAFFTIFWSGSLFLAFRTEMRIVWCGGEFRFFFVWMAPGLLWIFMFISFLVLIFAGLVNCSPAN
jgi:hypothetical protein